MIQGYTPVTLNAAIQQMRTIKTKSLQNDDSSNIKHLSKVSVIALPLITLQI